MHEVKDSMVKLFGISGTTYLKISYLEALESDQIEHKR